MDEGFFQAVYRLTAQIPPGMVVSYGQLARLLGTPRLARQVGWAMSRCPEALPWHRVVRADGSLAAGGDPALRRAVLEAEGVFFLADGRVDMRRCQWQPFPNIPTTIPTKEERDENQCGSGKNDCLLQRQSP